MQTPIVLHITGVCGPSDSPKKAGECTYSHFTSGKLCTVIKGGQFFSYPSTQMAGYQGAAPTESFGVSSEVL